MCSSVLRLTLVATGVALVVAEAAVGVSSGSGKAASVVSGRAAVVAAAPGDLDPTFGAGGEVTTNFAEDAAIQGVAVQPDGKIVAAGWTRIGGTADFALARYNPNGSLDGAFGNGGTLVTDFGAQAAANAVALQPDGKIVAAGFTAAFPGGFALARYKADGTLDPTFGSGGKVTTFFPFPAGNVEGFSVLIQPNGKIVAGGGAEGGGNQVSATFEVVRYNPDGSLDLTFGLNGIANTNFGGFDEVARAVALQSDGRIIEAGFTSGPCCTQANFALVRFTGGGTLDGTFGSGGKVTTDFDGQGDNAWSLAVQPDGKIVAAGVAALPTATIGFGLARYNLDGSLDGTFGTSGKVITVVGPGDTGRSVDLQANGKIVVAGLAETPTFSSDFGLVRYKPDGTLDPTFGTGGAVTTDFAGASDASFGSALQSDGKIVAVGVSSPSTGPAQFALSRYLGDPIAQPNTVKDGSFEWPKAPEGDVRTYFAPQRFADWHVASGSIDIVDDGYWQAAVGKQSLDLSGDDAGAIYQDLATVAGQSYTIAFSMAGNVVCSPAVKKLAVFWDGQQIAVRKFDTTGHSRTEMGWVVHKLRVVAAGASSRLGFRSLTAGPCGAALDRVRVVPVAQS